ncbi:hypothetical protein ACJX0J_019715, partial [Zea mays]
YFLLGNHVSLRYEEIDVEELFWPIMEIGDGPCLCSVRPKIHIYIYIDLQGFHFPQVHTAIILFLFILMFLIIIYFRDNQGLCFTNPKYNMSKISTTYKIIRIYKRGRSRWMHALEKHRQMDMAGYDSISLSET